VEQLEPVFVDNVIESKVTVKGCCK